MAMRKTNSPEIKLSSTADGGTPIPVLSFGANVSASRALTGEDFRIQNPNAPTTGTSPELDFTGYYDASHRLVFVLDKTMDERTPNTLLIINADADDPDRKWDDILENDYGLDVNAIRPKRDNKYQKLDIEYGGLSVYNNVINAHRSNADLTDALLGLSIFRDSVARKTAGDRLIAAEHKIGAATGTIRQTTESIEKLKERLVVLREKLSKQKKAIGREPTKESAAKILKTESQIDDAKERLKRANKRLRRAEARLDASRSDAENARKRLGMSVLNVVRTDNTSDGKARPIIPELKTRNKTTKPEPETLESNEEQKVESMAEENVTPLFDKDPDIMNEEIAFKPITFDMPSARPEPEKAPEFTPPVYNAPQDAIVETPKPAPEPRDPLFGAIPIPTSFATEPEPRPTRSDAPTLSENDFIPNNIAGPVMSAPAELKPTAPVMEPATEPPHPAEQFVPVAAPTLADTPITRPVSPTNGSTIPPVADRKKTSGIYYLLLVILIALSILTLWLYQKRTGDNTPNITDQVPTAPIEQTAPALENPFLMTESVAEPEPVAEVIPSEPTIEPAPTAPVAEPDNTYIPEPVGQIVTPAYEQPMAQPQIPTKEEIMARKPAYNIPDSELPGAVYDAGVQPYYEDEVVVVSGQVINEPAQDAAGQVYFNYERQEFEPVTPDQRVITPGVDVSQLGEPDQFHETYDSHETYEEYNEYREGNDADYNYYY